MALIIYLSEITHQLKYVYEMVETRDCISKGTNIN